MSTQYDHDGTDPTEESHLDLDLRCGECGEPLTLDLDTPIGLGGVDLKTPTALCSRACAEENVRRVTEVFDRCACGAVVTLMETLRTHGEKGVIGCAACSYSGTRAPSSDVRHFWAAVGALCQPPGEASQGLHVTIRQTFVDCPACLHALLVVAAMARSGS